MVFEFIAGGWKSMKQYFGFNNIIADSRHVANIDVIGQNVHGPEHDVQMSSNDHSNGWKNTVMGELRPYSKMGTLFDNVLTLNRDHVDHLTIIKRIDDKDRDLSVKMKYVNQRLDNTNYDSLTLRIDSKRKLANMFRPYAQINDEKTVGFKIEPDNDVFSGDVGFRHTSSDNRTTNMLYTTAQFKYPAGVADVKYSRSQRDTYRSPPRSTSFKMEMSNVFGYTFGHMGVFAGFKWMFNNPRRVLWRNPLYPEIKCGLAYPAVASQLTIKPNTNVCMLDNYWKVNDKLKVATSLNMEWKYNRWTKPGCELGVTYKHSDSLTVNMNSDLKGNISTGLSLTKKSMKLGLCYESNVRNVFAGRAFGFSLVF